MAENQQKIDELLRKLDLLGEQQSKVFQDIRSLREELEELKKGTSTPEASLPVEEIQPMSNVEEKKQQETPGELDLELIKQMVDHYKEGVTEGGKKFVRFVIISHGAKYEVICASNGSWIVQNKKQELVAKGRLKITGLTKTAQVVQGIHQGEEFSHSNLVLCIREAAGLLKPVEEQSSEPDILSDKPMYTSRAAIEPRMKTGLEKFIGENLIAVIAVCIILIGVVFGVKYSIDHNLISPLMRIVLSYLLGVGILGVGIKLKPKYELFSAILVSGSMAIMYFVTYVAYSFYGLIPQLPTFGIMVLFTGFTVFTAIHYNRQIIAHIALVGSYAVPIMLSDGSGNILALFIYMTIVNSGILAIALKKHWKPLYYVAFGFTWLIYVGWLLGAYSQSKHFETGLVFGAIFFLLFYATFLVYKLRKKELFSQEDVVMILLNSAIYYGTSYFILDGHPTGGNYLGLFTLATAVIHFVVSVILYNTKLADRKLFYLSSGMVLVFITMAVPVQLDGTWVTLLWGVEAAVLFWIGRTKAVSIYEWLSYPVMAIALVSLGHDWTNTYALSYLTGDKPSPFSNATFLTSAILALSYGSIVFINRQKEHKERFTALYPQVWQFLSVALPAVTILIVYNMLRLELGAYWNGLYEQSMVEVAPEYLFDTDIEVYNEDVLRFKNLWILIYTMIFVLALTIVNTRKFKSAIFNGANTILQVLVVFMFLTVGLYQLSELRESYIVQPYSEYFDYSVWSVGVRYFMYGLVAIILFSLYKTVSNNNSKVNMKGVIELFLHSSVLWVLCAELVNVLHLSGSHEQHKLGLSILCGLYAFVLIGIGIWKNRQHLRIAAFGLFGIVLIKLFLYDIAHLTTIAKTIVFISLGVILLVISFMYNKYKDKIQHEND